MGWFSRRKEEHEASLLATLVKAVGETVTGVLTAQSAQVAQNTAFLGTLQDLSAKKAAQIMGSRGGKISQAKKRARREAEGILPKCRLCTNPMARGVTLQELDIHRQHEGLVADAAASDTITPPPEERGN